jgi:cell wall-associated NlpC family hydrolase
MDALKNIDAHHLGLSAVAVMLALLAGCSSAPPAYRAAVSAPSLVSQEQAHDITIYAVGLVGTPYRYGGNTPDAGFDCSGLIGHVYQTRAALATPRTVARLQSWGQPVASESIRAGDLVLFAQTEVATHAGIYVGEGRFVHAPSTGGVVRLDNLNSKYWSRQQVAFRRP